MKRIKKFCRKHELLTADIIAIVIVILPFIMFSISPMIGAFFPITTIAAITFAFYLDKEND